MGNAALKGLRFGEGKATEEKLREVFAEFDKDGSGKLEKDEADKFFGAWLKSNGQKPDGLNIQMLWTELDANSDGTITIEELVAAAGMSSGTPTEQSKKEDLLGTFKQAGADYMVQLWADHWKVNGETLQEGSKVTFDLDNGVTQSVLLSDDSGYRFALEKNAANLWVLRDWDQVTSGEVLHTFEKSAFLHGKY